MMAVDSVSGAGDEIRAPVVPAVTRENDASAGKSRRAREDSGCPAAAIRLTRGCGETCHSQGRADDKSNKSAMHGLSFLLWSLTFLR